MDEEYLSPKSPVQMGTTMVVTDTDVFSRALAKASWCLTKIQSEIQELERGFSGCRK